RRLSAAQTFFGKSLTKNFSERIERQGLRPRTPWSFAVCGRRPKALPLETTSFLKKAGQKLLVSDFVLFVRFILTRAL
ncbi:MAG: hypothetical protein ACI4JM_09325, partial [Oscillospiraceae bacterium]